MIIALDFDGTLGFETKYGYFPNLPVIEKAKQLKTKGHKLILWTCRGGAWLKEAINFCSDYDLVFDSINENIKGIDYVHISCKAVADLYVDDKAPGSIEYFLNMEIIEIYSKPTYKSLITRSKDWLVNELQLTYDFCSKQSDRIKELEIELEKYRGK